jgi:hypothetical protein
MGDDTKMDNSKCLARRSRLFRILFGCIPIAILATGHACAQVCPPGKFDIATLAHGVSEAERQYEKYHADDLDNSGPPVNANVIYRSAAIAGTAMIPTLRRVSRPGFSPEDVPGAAQVSLAKLGDSEALEQLRLELAGKLGHGPWWAPRKLSRVGNDAAFELLMQYVVAKAEDPSRIVVHSDYAEDPLLEVLVSLSHIELILDPPSRPGNESMSPQKWLSWWHEVHSKSNVYSIRDAEFEDSRSQCLARKISWGFPRAILDLADSGDKRVVQFLTDLSSVGDKTEPVSSFDTVRGLAQTGLAILGNERQFELITLELDTLHFKDAINKLQAIGGKRAVATLINGFDSQTFLVDRPDYTADKEHIGGIIYDHDEAIASALIQMVVSPPDKSGTAGSKPKWKNWWAMNKDSAQFIVPRFTPGE